MNILEKLVLHIEDRKKYRTRVLPASDPQAIAEAAKVLSDGGVCAVPTETVYGLAASAFNEAAVARIFRVKGRPQNNPLIVHICGLNMAYPLLDGIPKQLKKLSEAFWPGPLTVIVKKNGLIPQSVSGGLDTVALRWPAHPDMQALIKACGFPIAAPSANLSGSPSPTTAQHCLNDLNTKVPLILDGGDCEVGVESTIVSIAGDRPVLLRPGNITLQQLREVLGHVDVADGVMHKPDADTAPLSPGMSYRHYAPKAPMQLVVSDEETFLNYIEDKKGDGVFALCFDSEGGKSGMLYESLGETEDPHSAQHFLFDALRALDERQARMIYARCPAEDGEWMAVFNRLQRAAEFDVVRPTPAEDAQ